MSVNEEVGCSSGALTPKPRHFSLPPLPTLCGSPSLALPIPRSPLPGARAQSHHRELVPSQSCSLPQQGPLPSSPCTPPSHSHARRFLPTFRPQPEVTCSEQFFPDLTSPCPPHPPGLAPHSLCTAPTWNQLSLVGWGWRGQGPCESVRHLQPSEHTQRDASVTPIDKSCPKGDSVGNVFGGDLILSLSSEKQKDGHFSACTEDSKRWAGHLQTAGSCIPAPSLFGQHDHTWDSNGGFECLVKVRERPEQ